MAKIIRLSENDLTRIVKRVLKEQRSLEGSLADRPGESRVPSKIRSGEQTQNSNITSPNAYGEAMIKTLGSNFAISTSQVDAMGQVKPGTFNTYFLQKFHYGDKWGKDGLSLNFKVRVYEFSSNKPKQGGLSLVIEFSNGVPTSLGPCFYMEEKGGALSLEREDIKEKLLPKIKNLRYKF